MLERVEQAVSELPVPSSVVELQPRRGDEQHEDQHPDQPFRSAEEPRKGFMLRHQFALGIALLLFLVAAPTTYLYWDYTRHFETTDDAFIAARQFAIAPKVSGYITAVPVTDNQHVAAGNVIARIDDRDYRVALEQAQSQVASAEANIQNIDAQIDVQQSQISASQDQVTQAEAALVFAQATVTPLRSSWRAFRTWRKRVGVLFRTPSSTRRNCINSRRQWQACKRTLKWRSDRSRR